MSTLEKTELNIGYIPLLDCVAILWAEKQGYFAEQGLTINLIREASWSSLRDRLAYGFLDAAHCLSAMLPAAALGTDQLQVALQTPLVLSMNQAFISLRQDLCHELGIDAEDDEKSSSQKLVQALQQQQKMNLAYVYKHSIHHYCIKEWLALTDVNITHKIQLMTSPPASMVKGISEQVFDGFCVGEPWNIQAKLEGYSLIVAASQNVIPKVADKVLAMTQEWAELHPCTVKALINAVQKAQTDLKQRADLSQVWDMLVDYQIIQFECSAQRHVCDYHKIQNIIRNLVGASAKPQLADFIWLIEQIEKWDGVEISEIEKKQIAAQCMYAEMLFA
ncbi:ABC transporter substrate-binding protein [Acinetobacter pseudolwoffii]|uniref:CmpA/NrtA family ABC transporter substrate-binding protein n=1 Tax=Acinetobacter pseudolwoffii TaxID=2053287 RepID=UPI001CE1798F|nr:CmpA/NrtA family ABC transporter substrate-binding protein [Acinetobacter pseudolwoffii]UBX53695.1 ABC transporter substrate-binding protein [Acinetobacter pseudolwoffii]